MENLEIKQIILLNVKSPNILLFVLTFMENLLLKTLACFFRKLSKKRKNKKGSNYQKFENISTVLEIVNSGRICRKQTQTK